MLASLAILTGACIVTPQASLAGDNPTSASLLVSATDWPPASVSSTRRCHLDLNDRMKRAMGTWGSNIVHPHGPNYFCAERHKQTEDQRN
jgi:hypothetical protein